MKRIITMTVCITIVLFSSNSFARWSNPERTSWGGIKKTSDTGQGTLYSKDNGNGKLDRNNHVHFHKDGITRKINGRHLPLIPRPRR